jgi:hypothetical protein
MNVIVVVFNPGAGGNFLARIFTLDPVTFCLGSKDIDSPHERSKVYCYDEPTGKLNANYKDGLSIWVYKELKEMYFPFSRGIENLVQSKQIVVEPMHPYHFHEKMKLLGPSDNVQFFFVDTQGCKQWVCDQIEHKILNGKYLKKHFSDYEKTLQDIVSSNPSFTAINLSAIIESPETFVDEYVRICKLMNINYYPTLALDIYQSWKKTWKH